MRGLVWLGVLRCLRHGLRPGGGALKGGGAEEGAALGHLGPGRLLLRVSGLHRRGPGGVRVLLPGLRGRAGEVERAHHPGLEGGDRLDLLRGVSLGALLIGRGPGRAPQRRDAVGTRTGQPGDDDGSGGPGDGGDPGEDRHALSGQRRVLQGLGLLGRDLPGGDGRAQRLGLLTQAPHLTACEQRLLPREVGLTLGGALGLALLAPGAARGGGLLAVDVGGLAHRRSPSSCAERADCSRTTWAVIDVTWDCRWLR